MPSLNEEIRDEYIGHETQLRRVESSIGRRVDAEMLRLQRDLGELTRRIDPTAPAAKRFQQRREIVLKEAGDKLIKKRMSEISRMVQKSLGVVAKLEAEFTEDLLRKQLNGV